MKMPDLSTPVCSVQGQHKTARDVITNAMLHFPEGLPGFSALRRGTISSTPMIEPFFHLHAQNIADLVFVCVEPFLICPDYSVSIPDTFAHSLGLTNSREAWLVSIVTLAADCEDITANLMCPLVINVRTFQARQLIIEDAEDMLRYRIWDQIQMQQQKVS